MLLLASMATGTDFEKARAVAVDEVRGATCGIQSEQRVGQGERGGVRGDGHRRSSLRDDAHDPHEEGRPGRSDVDLDVAWQAAEVRLGSGRDLDGHDRTVRPVRVAVVGGDLVGLP
jgi:hypothetical protein